jgi:hypothetical protein
VCYDNPVDLSGDANVLQRNGTLLQTYVPTFCGQDPPQLASTGLRSAMEGLLAVAGRALLPRPLLAATLNPPATGGSPIDFGHFAPVAANPAGRLQFVVPPTDGVEGTPLDSFTVAALSGEGTQIERVTIELYLSSNNGVPAGADFCDTTSCPAPTDTTKGGARRLPHRGDVQGRHDLQAGGLSALREGRHVRGHPRWCLHHLPGRLRDDPHQEQLTRRSPRPRLDAPREGAAGLASKPHAAA